MPNELDTRALEAATEALWAKLKASTNMTLAAARETYPGPDLLPAATRRDAEDAIRAYLAALPEREGLGVKALEWKKLSEARTADTYGCRFIARCSFGEYFINSTPYGNQWNFSRLGYAEIEAGSENEAKAAAQADYEQRIRDALSAPAERGVEEPTFQQRVKPWMDATFGPAISADKVERNHRFLEEALELVQAIGCTQSEAHQLVDYVYGRPQGEINQEVGGVMVTLAALSLANGIDMHAGGETELTRIWTKVDQIRAKQAAKPQHSPLPGAAPTPPAGMVRALRALAEASRAVLSTLSAGQSLNPAGASLTNRLDSITAEVEASLAAAPGQPAQGDGT